MSCTRRLLGVRSEALGFSPWDMDVWLLSSSAVRLVFFPNLCDLKRACRSYSISCTANGFPPALRAYQQALQTCGRSSGALKSDRICPPLFRYSSICFFAGAFWLSIPNRVMLSNDVWREIESSALVSIQEKDMHTTHRPRPRPTFRPCCA